VISTRCAFGRPFDLVGRIGRLIDVGAAAQLHAERTSTGSARSSSSPDHVSKQTSFVFTTEATPSPREIDA